MTPFARLVPLTALLAVLAAGSPAAAQSVVYTWGDNTYGQLGTGSTTPSFSLTPVQIAVGGSGALTSVAAGSQFGFAIRNGVLYSWGYNVFGELGTGVADSMPHPTPAPAVVLTSGVTGVSGGANHALAVKDGNVYAWGRNVAAELGIGGMDLNTHPTPVQVLTGGVTAVAAGLEFSLAIKSGGMYAWGNNNTGQLGLSSGTLQFGTPQAAGGVLASQVTAVAAGGFHGLAVRDGAAYAWGTGGSGQLGQGGTSSSPSPLAVPGLTANVSAVSAGFQHSLAVMNGDVYAWGRNDQGQVGNNTTTQQNSPVLVTGGVSYPHNFVKVAAGEYYSLALTADHRLFVWGSNSSGMLGLGSPPTNRLVPTELAAPPGFYWSDIDGGWFHTVALATPVPEPVSVGLLAAVVGLVGAVRRGRRPTTSPHCGS